MPVHVFCSWTGFLIVGFVKIEEIL